MIKAFTISSYVLEDGTEDVLLGKNLLTYADQSDFTEACVEIGLADDGGNHQLIKADSNGHLFVAIQHPHLEEELFELLN
tara:strand:+ start:6716 stop:6955 length:240 start_codon:yes stop_codon:yes gene_type:complete